jgi:diguanylate cyclase (GGDEF)-like protein
VSYARQRVTTVKSPPQKTRDDAAQDSRANAAPTQTCADSAPAFAALGLNTEEILKHKPDLEQLNSWFEIALENMARGLSMFDADQRLIVCNKMYREIYHLPEELTRAGTPLSDIVRYHVRGETGAERLEDIEKQRKWIEQHLRDLESGKCFSYVQELKDGRTILVTSQPIVGGGWVDLQEDITEKRLAEQKISWLARHDTLTEIANRFHFREQLECALQDLQAGDGFAILWLDLDKFKEVNDTLGHPVGDALLQSVAQRLREALRRRDLIGRLGGDEFAVLQRNVKRKHDAELLAARLLRAIGETHYVGKQRLHADASIGIVYAPEDGQTIDELLKNVDIALYKAKARGGGCYAVFEPGEDERLRERHQLEADFKFALSRQELALHYQPIINIKTNEVSSFEALMRWHYPQRGMISPADFIPIAEQTGLIVPMGEWALRQACKDAASWPEPIGVTVNLSSIQFERGDLVGATKEALQQSGLAPSRLELEVTESVLLCDAPKTKETLARLHDLGVRIALDDFGTAFASLSYLQSFPFDKLKIDRSFVREIPERADSLAIVQAVTNLARNLKMNTVAEGIETRAHLTSVSGAGCDEVQGFYFSRPVPATQVDEVLGLCRLKCMASNHSSIAHDRVKRHRRVRSLR